MSEPKTPTLLTHLDAIFECALSSLTSTIQCRRQVLRVVAYPRDPDPHESTDAPNLGMPPFTSVGEAISAITNLYDLVRRQETCLAEELRQSYIELANHVENEVVTVSGIEDQLVEARQLLALNGYHFEAVRFVSDKDGSDVDDIDVSEGNGTPVAWAYLNSLSKVTERTSALSGNVLAALTDLTRAVDPLAAVQAKAKPTPVDPPVAGVIDV